MTRPMRALPYHRPGRIAAAGAAVLYLGLILWYSRYHLLGEAGSGPLALWLTGLAASLRLCRRQRGHSLRAARREHRSRRWPMLPECQRDTAALPRGIAAARGTDLSAAARGGRPSRPRDTSRKLKIRAPGPCGLRRKKLVDVVRETIFAARALRRSLRAACGGPSPRHYVGALPRIRLVLASCSPRDFSNRRR
jgi:hypothetical protein